MPTFQTRTSERFSDEDQFQTTAFRYRIVLCLKMMKPINGMSHHRISRALCVRACVRAPDSTTQIL